MGKEAESLWHDLAGKDAARAYQAINRLAMAPEVAVGLCRSKLSPIPAPDAKRIDGLIDDLDDGDFMVRERATEELEKLARLAAPRLEKALAGQPPLEVRRRLERLLARLDKLDHGPEVLRALRAIEVLERLGTAQARQLLEELSRGAAGAILTQDARRALHR
ncbi:MAG: hypothetical protein AB7K24_25930 [Gemmataceae bacterium]